MFICSFFHVTHVTSPLVFTATIHAHLFTSTILAFTGHPPHSPIRFFTTWCKGDANLLLDGTCYCLLESKAAVRTLSKTHLYKFNITIQDGLLEQDSDFSDPDDRAWGGPLASMYNVQTSKTVFIINCTHTDIVHTQTHNPSPPSASGYLYVYVCVYVCECTSAWMYECASECTCMSVWVCLHVCMYVCVCACVCACVRVRVSMRVQVCVCVRAQPPQAASDPD